MDSVDISSSLVSATGAKSLRDLMMTHFIDKYLCLTKLQWIDTHGPEEHMAETISKHTFSKEIIAFQIL